MAVKLVVISPEQDDPRELTVLRALFNAGLERYHVRKPAWSREQLAEWLHALPREWRPRLVLHQHHELAGAFALGGVHWRDDGTTTRGGPAEPSRLHSANGACFTSRSCHELSALHAALGHYDSVFFSPVFPSLSKPGHAPRAGFPVHELSSLLARRTVAERRTQVVALGGITAENAPRALALGFDGVAVLGAIWQSTDPVRAFAELQTSLTCHAA